MAWEAKAKERKARILETIPPEWRLEGIPTTDSVMSIPEQSGILTSDELAITESSATSLVNDIATGKLSSVAVTTAFCKRAVLAHQLVNCLHEFLLESALERARYLDQYLEENKKTVGPLHGLPVSLKDQFRIKGFETTMGYVGWIGKIDEENSVMVDLLKKAGAVFYVKTSVPQTLMSYETFNNIIGRTVNPRNKNLSSGGSSGGEGALIAFRGSVLGLGTDLGGSIRVPAAYNFLYGIRPSHGRLPYAKMANSMAGQEAIHSVCGPLAHSVADMRLLVQTVLKGRPWDFDSKVVPMPWRQDEEDSIKEKIASRSLTLGFYSYDGVVVPHPPILRAIQTVVDTLKEVGHAVVPWDPYKHSYAGDLCMRLYMSDGGSDLQSAAALSGEPSIPNVARFFNPSLPKLSLNEAWECQLEKWQYQMDYLAAIRDFEAKTGRELDAIIAPIMATAPVRHERTIYGGYAAIVNLLDFTSVVVPVTTVNKDRDVPVQAFTPKSQQDADVQAEYDADVYHGAPVAVQIIGRRFTEERIMAIAEEVGRLLHNP